MTLFSLDLIGSGLSLAATLLYVAQSIWAWPVSLVAIAINATLFLNVDLYADFSLEIIYAILSLYGWWVWLAKTNQKAITVSRVPNKYLLPGLLLSCISIGLVYQILLTLKSTVAFMDAFTAVLSVVGQWLTARKYIECWFIWFIVDATYIALYAIKGIPFHSILLFVYCFIAIAGYFRWRKDLLQESHKCPSDVRST